MFEEALRLTYLFVRMEWMMWLYDNIITLCSAALIEQTWQANPNIIIYLHTQQSKYSTSEEQNLSANPETEA